MSNLKFISVYTTYSLSHTKDKKKFAADVEICAQVGRATLL